MKISTASWHYRFLARTHERWFRGYDDLDPERYHNLCPYLRAVLLWCPLTWLLGILYTVLVKPFRLLAWAVYWQYAKRTYLVENGEIKRTLSGRKILRDPKPAKPRKSTATAGPGMWELVGEWVEARHKKVCPQIEFET